MSIGLIDSLTPAQRRFVLLDDGVGAFVVNLLLNGAIAWLLFRKATHVPMWGQSSIADDTIVTAFLLPAITCLIAKSQRVARDSRARRARGWPIAEV
jgi:hypothetical protein